ncbi:MAG: acyltransferase family protein [Rhodoferax sp.]|nr:acyltransferase family protein [Rhodoferax sp.]MDP3652777.1 acyltransferase family protein [Rhodoferax sp.]
MNKLNYRPDVDGLRAIAVLAVLGFHAFPTLFPGGFVGVDVFFVISGYLITRILLQAPQGEGIRIRSFYARRIVRIFPALIVVLAACLFAGWHTLLAAEYKQLGKHVFAGAGFVSNLALWFEAGYFDAVSESKPLLHLWSLGIEEQFYIFWPLALVAFTRYRCSPLPWVGATLLCSLCYSGLLVWQDRTQAFYSPLPRAWELLAGAVLGYMQHSNKHTVLLRLNGPATAWVGLLLLMMSVFFLRSSDMFPGLWALLPVIGAVFLLAGTPSSWLNSRLLAHPVMVNIGLISYPLYLWHWPLISFASIIHSGQPDWDVCLALLAASFLLATTTYQLVEKPIQKMVRKGEGKLVLTLLVTMMVLLGLMGKNVYDRDGLERIRYKTLIGLDAASQRDFVEWEHSGLITQSNCRIPFQFPGREYCLTKHVERPPTAALIGDSHAFHAYWGIAEALDQIGENLILVGRGACVPLIDYSRGRDEDLCQPHMNAMLSYAANEPNIKKIILVFRGRYLPNEADPQTQSRFRSSLERTLSRLLAAGKNVYYLLPVVEPGFDPRLCLGNLPFGRQSPMPCDISRSRDAEKTVLLRSIVMMVVKKYPNVELMDPNNYLCDGDICPVIRNTHPMFKDENHLSYSGSLFLGTTMPWSVHDRTNPRAP